MKPKNLFKNVTVLLVIKNKIVCVSRKKDHKDFGLPGGKIEEGETFEEAAKREIYEEVGLKIRKLVPVFHNQDTITFLATEIGDLEGSEEPHNILLSSSWKPLIKGSFKRYNKQLRKFIASREDLHNNIPVLCMVQKQEGSLKSE